MTRYEYGLGMAASGFFAASTFGFTRDPWVAVGVFSAFMGTVVAAAFLVEASRSSRRR